MTNTLTYKYITNYLELTEDNFYFYLGQQLRILRKKHGYTLKQIANYLKVSCQQVQKYEIGKNRISAWFILKLMDLFKVNIYEILQQQDPNEDVREALKKHDNDIKELDKDIKGLDKRLDKDIKELKNMLKELINKQNKN